MSTIAAANHNPKGPVTILGDAYVGEILIARPNAIGDEDGIDYDTATFQWLRDGDAIEGETTQYYSVSEADVGAQISIRYSYVDFGGTEEILISDPEPIVPVAGTPIPEDTDPYNALMVLGDAFVGERLTARPNAVTDENGIDYETTAFQWLRDGDPIPGATDQSYDVTAADIDAEISVEFSYQDLLGASKFLTSNSKSEVPMPDAGYVEPSVPSLPSVPSDGGESEDVEDLALNGTADADALHATYGLKRINGLEDTDTAFFEGDQSNYTVTVAREGVSVTDHRENGLGTIALDNVELIDFDTEIPVFGGPMELDRYSGLSDLGHVDVEAIVEMYIAYFNRAPDAVGLNFWASAFADGTSLEDMAVLFMQQDETAAIYPDGTSNSEFATSVYANVLGRVPDQAGMDFWVSALDSELVSRDQFILRVLDGAKSPLKDEEGEDFVAQQLADRAYLEAKVDVGALFAVEKGMSDVDNASAVMTLFDTMFDGTQSSVDDAVAAIEGFYQDALDPTDGEFLLQVVGVWDNPFAV